MCYIWCGIFPLDFTTTIDIVPQSVAFLLQSVVFPMNYPKTNCSIVLQNKIVYNKNSILLNVIFSGKNGFCSTWTRTRVVRLPVRMHYH